MRPGPPRRGVLLLVVLSLLVLFMLIGTAFLMSSNQYRGAAKEAAKFNRVGSPPTKLLDRAVMQIVRDTDNTQSAIRYHSLLRDLYGTDGFEAVVYSPQSTLAFDSTVPVQQVTRFAGATSGTTDRQLGPTQGQLIDLYVRQLGFSAGTPTPFPDDPLTSIDETSPSTLRVAPDARQVLALESDPLGQPKIYSLPLTKGYFNGCLLTITSGPAKGQSARILDYEFINTIPPTGTILPTRLFRFRVMAFPRTDGSPLQIDQSVKRSPELIDLAGATIVVNGRAFTGTGVGYNPFAAAGAPKLSAVEAINIAGSNSTTMTNAIYPEIALTPNSTYFFPADPRSALNVVDAPAYPAADPNDALGARYKDASGKYQPLNPKNSTLANRAAQWKYQTFTGPGDADESYDAADFQNMFLALQTVTPRSQGRVVHTTGEYNAEDPVAFNNPGNFLRLDLEDLPLPSFHRPDLENYWFHWLMRQTFLSSLSSDNRVKAILQPYDASGNLQWGLTDQQAGQITALKRMASLRPLREDHPHFDGSNPRSRPANLSGVSNLVKNGNIAIPYWEAVGPWDVDNDNDGVPDSVWVDLGDPVTQAEDGTLYKPLYAFLVQDMDSRLNVNAHGLMSELAWNKKGAATTQTPPGFDPTLGNPGNLARTTPAAPVSSNILPRGIGYGPAEISLRPALSPTLPTLFPNNVGDPGTGNPVNADDFARILVGRPANTGVPSYASVWGRNGSVDVWNGIPSDCQPGMYYDSTSLLSAQSTISQLTVFKFIGYPAWMSWFYSDDTNPANSRIPSAFGIPPDLNGRYGIGVDYAGQPVFEVADEFRSSLSPPKLGQPIPTDRFAQPTPTAVPNDNAHKRNDITLLFNTPYDTNLSDPIRRDEPDASFTTAMVSKLKSGGFVAFDDDAPYATADLERVLRAHDADTGALPDRLWNVVDAFDPVKLVQNQPAAVNAASLQLFGTTSPNQAQALAAAQQMASISRRLVTTDSYDLPVPSQNMPSWVPDAGPDTVATAPDDFQTITGHSRAQATIVDLLHYRVFLDQRRIFLVANNLTSLTTAGRVNTVKASTEKIFTTQLLSQQLLAPEVIAGQKMDLNRPFGDGEDNNNNGVVDEPEEAGEPYIDKNDNGKYDPGEPFLDVNGNGQYDAPTDALWKSMTAGNVGYPVDYTNGVDASGNGWYVDKNGNGVYDAGEPIIRNANGYLARQLFARQLYCLTLLLVDPDYVVPIDETDPQTMLFIDQTLRQLYNLPAATPTSTLTVAQVTQGTAIAQRKLTCRKIAQWAINVVDARDPDSIMTPFEYDEDPWDGWNCTEYTATGAIKRQMPLDGDVATNENLGVTRTVDPSAVDWKVTPSPTPFPANYQTRGLVWGVERPELVITETLALHDRRATDETFEPSPNSIFNRNDPPASVQDKTLDQRLKPQGSLFVELYNPWSDDAQKPADLYRYPYKNALGVALPPTAYEHIANGVERQGVLLHRLSDPITIAGNAMQSPVWRLTIVKQSSQYARPSTVGQTSYSGTALATAFSKLPAPLKEAIPDGLQGTTTRRLATQQFFMLDPDSPEFIADGNKPNPANLSNPTGKQPYAERWVYFAGDPSIAGVPQLRLPSICTRAGSPIGGVSGATIPTGRNYFLASDRLPPAGTNPNPADPVNGVLAPIMPGCYAVVGTAGPQYKAGGVNYTHLSASGITGPPRFITTIGRIKLPSAGNTTFNADNYHVSTIPNVRRIEMIPQRDPMIQQFCMEKNGGNEFVKINGMMTNVTDEDGLHTVNNIRPCVAIPIADLSVTEPVEGYLDAQGRVYADYYNLYKDDPDANPGITDSRKIVVNQYGEEQFVKRTQPTTPYPFEVPLDIDLDLVRDGTTPNYRSIHLQRLANPHLPWNPLPTFPDGSTNSDYNAAIPVNPYLTIDSASVDMTAFNGAVEYERTELPTDSATNPLKGGNPQLVGKSLQPSDDPDGINVAPNEWHKLKRYLPFQGRSVGTQNRNAQFQQYFDMGSLERGYHTKMYPDKTLARVPRTLWDQERPNVKRPLPSAMAAGKPDGENAAGGDLFDVPYNNLRRTQLQQQGVPPQEIDSMLPSQEHVIDFVLGQTLGFQNASLGPFLTSDDVTSGKAPATAKGAPAPTTINNQPFNSTFPWLAWNDRPYVGANEILQVPAAPSSRIMRQFSTINIARSTVNTPNTYDGDGLIDPTQPITLANLEDEAVYPVPNRRDRFAAPFGELLNPFQATTKSAQVAIDNVTGQPIVDANRIVKFIGAPNFNRILDFVQVPSRFVGTDELLNPDVFASSTASPITAPNDPRYGLQPPFNKVSRQRDPGRVNLNTVLGRRIVDSGGIPRIWSEVYDGIMHRGPLYDSVAKQMIAGDGDILTWPNYPSTSPPPTRVQLGHAGPAFRDVELSRRGYAQIDAGGNPVDRPGTSPAFTPDTFAFGLNPAFPTFFSNPFRSASAGDLVPISQMMQYGVDASMLRVHPRFRLDFKLPWGAGVFGDARDAGFGQDQVSKRGDGCVPGDLTVTAPATTPARDVLPLFSELRNDPAYDTTRNPYMMYQPMTRLGNLVTEHSNVFAVWVTVGYFEVEKAPDWSIAAVQQRFGGDGTAGSPATIAARALYDRVYPEGYALAQEVGSDTGNTKRQRGFYIIDRTIPVGFKPGEDLNDDRAIKVRRRIE